MAGLHSAGIVRVITVLLFLQSRPASTFHSPSIGGIDCVRHLLQQKTNFCDKLLAQKRGQSQRTRSLPVWLSAKKHNNDEESNNGIFAPVLGNPGRALTFSIFMTLSGAVLGPFLDSFHSAFGVLQYDVPITMQLWGRDAAHPALITAWWVPELFGLAGFLIGWLYLLFDRSIGNDPPPSPPKILFGISLFTFQYWLSGLLFQLNIDRSVILNVMSLVAAAGFWVLDGTMAGFIVSAMTALGGPAIEVGLLSVVASHFDFGGYHYNDLGETGYFPLWIIPVYFLGGPANGNLAKGYWNYLSNKTENDYNVERKKPIGCLECNDTRCVPCPNW